MQYWQRRLHRSVTDTRRLRSGREKVSGITPLFYRGLVPARPASVPSESAGLQGLRPHPVGEKLRDLTMDEPRIAACGTLLDTIAPTGGAGVDPAPERHIASPRNQSEVFQVRHTGLRWSLPLGTCRPLADARNILARRILLASEISLNGH